MGYMQHAMKKPEILAPAGSMEALETACLYGADAVYLGIRGETNLRSGAKNFSFDEFPAALGLAHESGVKVYLTLNTYPHDEQLRQMPDIIRLAAENHVDAIIVSDLGVLRLVRSIAPGMPLHLSTQANAVNSAAVNAWDDLGISRVILARELSRGEIASIRGNTKIELEIFVHGSMCISISGRCLISNYLNARDANQGGCTQPCRWEYALVERTRAGEYLPVVEDDGFTYLYNSRDLCLMPVFDQVMALGVDGLKIEGRNKTALYVATIVSAYCRARDAWMKDPQGFQVQKEWLDELMKASHRGYFTGFFSSLPDTSGTNYDFKGYTQTHHLAARVLETNGEKTILEARNPLIEGMQLEWLAAAGKSRIFELKDAQAGGTRKTHIRPNEVFAVKLPFAVRAGELIRKPYSQGDKVVPKKA